MADDLDRYLWNQLADPEFARAYVAEQKEIGRAKDAEIARLVGADRENYALTAEVQVLREENERLRTALEEIKPYTSASSPVGMIVRDVLASLDGEKEGEDA